MCKWSINFNKDILLFFGNPSTLEAEEFEVQLAASHSISLILQKNNMNIQLTGK